MNLLDQICNDRFAENELSHGGDPVTESAYRKGWNSASRHIEGLVRMHAGLSELREAEPMDLTLKAALTGVAP